MRKVIFASHHTLAAGMKDTVEYIIPNAPEITAISAYLDNVPVEEAIKKALNGVGPDDEVLVFTDLLSGSVNQGFIPYLNQPNIHVITGMNLPVIMAVVLGTMGQKITPELIQKSIADARTQLVYVNDYLQAQVEADEEDE